MILMGAKRCERKTANPLGVRNGAMERGRQIRKLTTVREGELNESERQNRRARRGRQQKVIRTDRVCLRCGGRDVEL